MDVVGWLFRPTRDPGNPGDDLTSDDTSRGGGVVAYTNAIDALYRADGPVVIRCIMSGRPVYGLRQIRAHARQVTEARDVSAELGVFARSVLYDVSGLWSSAEPVVLRYLQTGEEGQAAYESAVWSRGSLGAMAVANATARLALRRDPPHRAAIEACRAATVATLTSRLSGFDLLHVEEIAVRDEMRLTHDRMLLDVLASTRDL